MGLINLDDIEQGNEANAELWNSRFAIIVGVINGNLSADNLASEAVTTAKIANGAVTEAKIAEGAITGDKMNADATGIGFLEIARTTLGSAGDTISVTAIPEFTYLKVVIRAKASGQIRTTMTFNNDTATNYAARLSSDGGADAASASIASITLDSAAAVNNVFAVADITNFDTSEKSVIAFCTRDNTTGAANVPSRRETVAKWSNVLTYISRVDVINNGTGSFDTGSEVIVYGHN